jgi:hypothetical protein
VARRVIHPPEVAVEPGSEAAGMASMVAELLRANLADSPVRARVARRARGSAVLMMSDRDLGVMVTFGAGVIVVSGSAVGAVPALSGGWLEMAAVCTGTRSPLRALLRREITVTVRRPVSVLATIAFTLNVPRSVGRARG